VRATGSGLRSAFVCSAGVLLFGTAIAKLLSAGGRAPILDQTDPFFSISFRHLFWIVGAIELAVALVCFFGQQPKIQMWLVAWLSTSFLVYRIGLVWIGYQRPCPCLGSLTDALRISSHLAGVIMGSLLGYLIAGSFAGLFLKKLWVNWIGARILRLTKSDQEGPGPRESQPQWRVNQSRDPNSA
jgi:hypothetical protein